METILAGYDGSRPAEQALTRAAEFARTFEAKVVVVSVAAPEPLSGPGAFGLMPYYYPAEEAGQAADLDETLLRQHQERVEAFFAGREVPVEFVGVTGDAAAEIVAAADEHDVDLIVVGTREPGFLERLLGGSVSQGVARRAHRDVLIVHPDEQNEASEPGG